MIRLSLLTLLLLSQLIIYSQSSTHYLLGRTCGELPFLEYGLGADRLGGAKMGLLDTSVLLKIVDSTVVNYRVQLSSSHYAYINKSNIKWRRVLF